MKLIIDGVEFLAIPVDSLPQEKNWWVRIDGSDIEPRGSYGKWDGEGRKADGEGSSYEWFTTKELAIEFSKTLTEPKVLFTTEDGVEITNKEQVVFSVCPKAQWQTFSIIPAGRIASHNGWQAWKHFSTREKRDEYILMNKPLLSISDIKSLDEDISVGVPFGRKDLLCELEVIKSHRLIELAKQKLNIQP